MIQRTELHGILHTAKKKPVSRDELKRNLRFVDAVAPGDRNSLLDEIVEESAVIPALYARGANAEARRAIAEISARYDPFFDDDLSGGRAERDAAHDAMSPRELAQEICNNRIAV